VGVYFLKAIVLTTYCTVQVRYYRDSLGDKFRFSVAPRIHLVWRITVVRVLVVDDFAPWQEFVTSALQSDPQYEVVGFVSDGATAITECKRLKPDLILLDIGLPDHDGITVAKQIRRVLPESDIVFFTQHTSMDYVQAAFELGARGFIDKRDGRELLEAINTVRKHRHFVSKRLNEATETGSEVDQD
jgi:DNA-binding NarL/FixJ family response regulator